MAVKVNKWCITRGIFIIASSLSKHTVVKVDLPVSFASNKIIIVDVKIVCAGEVRKLGQGYAYSNVRGHNNSGVV